MSAGFKLGRRVVPLGFVVQLDLVAVRILAHEGRAVAQIAFVPTDVEFGAFEGRDAPFERLRAARAKSHVAHSSLLRGGELEGVALVIVPGAQVDRIAFPAAFGHPHDVDEEAQAFLRLGGEKLQMPQVGDVSDGFVLHANCKVYRAAAFTAGEPAWRGASTCVRLAAAQPDVDLFQRSEESHERAAQMGRRTPRLPEIAMPELVGRCDHCAAHGTVFMRSLRPRQTVLGVDPHRESHVILWTARERIKTL